jgi:hypothetical protein
MSVDVEASAVTREEGLAALSEALLVQHLKATWPRPQASATWFRKGPTPKRYSEDIRTVAVVGAGASQPIMAAAGELADELEQEADRLHGSDERDAELDKLEAVNGLNREDFETRLLAICRTPEEERKVREAISARFRHRHPTLLAYELVAHLMHHRFLDAVVSFNFDELLDQSIEDELGPNEYTKVVSERDCLAANEAGGPIFIKPHGTAAEPESLRFSNERYFTLPKSITRLLEERFDTDHLVLLNVGYAMQNIDFQYLLRKPKEVEIFNFNPHSLPEEAIDTIAESRESHREGKRDLHREAAYDAPRVFDLAPEGSDGSDPRFLDNLLKETTECLEAACKEDAAGPTHWRSTKRHLALVRLLREFDNTNERGQAEYLRRRAVLEIALAAAKGRGVVSISSMVDDRCGRYYDLYAQKAKKPDRWPKVCADGGLQESATAADTYEVLRELLADPEEGDIHQLRLPDPVELAKHTARQMDLGRSERGELTDLLAKTLEALQTDAEIEIHSRDDRVCSKIFTEPEILNSMTALQGWTHELLHATSYDQIWLISETGEWLAEPETEALLKQRCRRVKLLRAFDTDVEPQGFDDFAVRKLPWGRHNRHMTILCEREEPRAAIYFVRRLRSATVTPVYLWHQDDLKRMKNAFKQLWKEAKRYEREIKEPAE